MLEDLRLDVRIGLRGLLRAPLMTLIIIVTVGLGLGATTAIFAAIDAALLRPLPYAEPERRMRIFTDAPPNKFPFSVADYLALQSQQTQFDRIAAYRVRVSQSADRRHPSSEPHLSRLTRGRILGRIDAALPFSNVATIDELVDRSLARPRSLSILLGALATVALLLSVIGVYGVMAYYVQQHAKEIGIRLALGGDRSDLFRLVVGQGMAVVVAGVGVGLLVSFAAARAMSSLLFGVGTADPGTFGAVAALLALVAFAACVRPAYCATTVQPASVLRDE